MQAVLPIRTHKYRAAIGLFLVVIAALGQLRVEARIPIEQLQRQIQERFYFLTYGNYIIWPACRSGQPAPLYPPDGFYGNLDNDAYFAAYLVQDAAHQFFGGEALYGYGVLVRWPLYYIGYPLFDWYGDYFNEVPLCVGGWVQTGFNPEGIYPADLTDMLYGSEDFPTSGNGFDFSNVTPANYALSFSS
jgi:hypothetical protein